MQTDLNSMEKFGEAKSRRADEIGTVGYKMVWIIGLGFEEESEYISGYGQRVGKNGRDLGCRGTKGCSPGRGFLSTDTRDWLCARGRMPFSRHVRDVCLRRTGMKSSDKLRWDEWEEFRQDRSHPQYRGHLLLPCTPRKKKKEKEKANSPARKCRGRRWKRRSRRRENRRNCNKMAAINNTAKNCIKFALDAFLLKS